MTTTTTLRSIDPREAYEGSFYTIAGCGGDLQEWIDGYQKLLDESNIGTPTAWYQLTGQQVNEFAGPGNTNPFQDDCMLLAFPLDGLAGKLAMFKLQMQDRWFDDVIDNMRPDA